jgi:hypothetical protein
MKFRADKNFVPCPISDGDGYYRNGILVFNITRLKKLNSGEMSITDSDLIVH